MIVWLKMWLYPNSQFPFSPRSVRSWSWNLDLFDFIWKPCPVFFAQIGSGQVVRGSCAGVDRENGRASAMLRRFFLQRSLLRGFRESHPTNIKTTPQHGTLNTKPGGLGGWESTHAIPWEDVLRYTCLKMRWLFQIDKTSLGHTSQMHYSRSILLYLYMSLHLYSCFIMLLSLLWWQ